MEINWNEILSAVLQSVLLLTLPPLAVAVYKFILAKAAVLLSEAQEWNPTVTDFLMQAARFAVEAAEQAGLAELTKNKKMYALEVAELWLKAKGVEIDLALIDAAVEKAVAELNNYED
jgi:hypothetical protein